MVRLPHTLAVRLRPVYVALTVVLLGLAAVELVVMWHIVDGQDAIGADPVFYRDMAQRWLDTGVWYTDQQLEGPYTVVTLVHNLYPPHALYLFLPFTVAPLILWWLIPAVFVAWVVWRLRPRMGAWPILALVLVLPKTPVAVLYGNSDLWVTAAVAAAVLWGWPAVLVSFKPSVGFLALIGIRGRSWWLAVACLAVLSLPMVELWLDWVPVIRNATVSAQYSLANLPLILLPVIAWVGSSRRSDFRVPARLDHADTAGARLATS